ATTCASSGSLPPTPVQAGAMAYDYSDPQVLIDGGIVSIIAYTVSGTTGIRPGNYSDDPLQEWQAPDGSASFSLVNNGQSPADPGGVAGAVDVPGSNELGLLWVTGTAPAFAAFPLLNPPQCSAATYPQCP